MKEKKKKEMIDKTQKKRKKMKMLVRLHSVHDRPIFPPHILPDQTKKIAHFVK